MNRPRGGMSAKRKRPDDDPSKNLNNGESVVLDLIRSKGDMGIWVGDVKKELKHINPKDIAAAVKNLQAKKMIKEVVNCQNKGRNRLMGVEFEPSKEVTGGEWYNNGSLDTDFIENLRILCSNYIRRKKVATAEEIHSFVNNSKAFNVNVQINQIRRILENLAMDNIIVETKSTGTGDCSHIPIQAVCYKSVNKGVKVSYMAAIPCGACPRINYCTPDGVISPATCEYYTKWLEF